MEKSDLLSAAAVAYRSRL